MTASPANWFDFLIIGSGTAGSVLASRLSEDPGLRIGLVEAGGAALGPLVSQPDKWPLLQGGAFDWAYRTVPQRHTAGRTHEWARGRAIGGSTVINAMAHVRGHASDFDRWAEAGCEGWGFRDLLPYFIRSETYEPGASPYHGGSGPVHLIRPREPHPVTLAYMAAGEEGGIPPSADHNGPRLAGPCLNTLTIKDAKRQSIADAYLTPAAGRANLVLLAETEALSLILEGGRCAGVRLRGRDGVFEARAERGVILSAGTIASPSLLLRSGIGPAEELRALGIEVRLDLPGVGRNLHDHLLSGGNVYRARRPVPPSKYQSSESLMYIERASARPRSAPMGSAPMGSAPMGSALMGSAPTGPAPELVLACVVLPVTTEQFAAPAIGEAYTLMFGFTHPRSRGTIRLASADPGAPPLIDPNYLAESYDREAYLDALNAAQAVGGAAALADWRAEELLPGPAVRGKAERLAFLEKAAFTHHHPVGTCRLGSDPGAVVDPRLRLRGIEGLHVCDASVFPSITTGPVNAAVIAIAERASDLLRGVTPLTPTSLPATS